jgi:protein tyrosine/serine phosphatase
MEPTVPRKASKRKRLAIGLAVALVVAGASAYAIKNYAFHARFETVVEGKVYRSYQPSPQELRDWVARYGIRTVINLRGQSPDLPQEQAATREAKVSLHTFRFSASRQPGQEDLVRLIGVLETAERPILIHCRQGVDRTGTVAALAAMAIGGQSLAQAKAQLPLVKTSKGANDISDLIGDFESYCKAQGASDESWAAFRKWATEVRQPPPTAASGEGGDPSDS